MSRRQKTKRAAAPLAVFAALVPATASAVVLLSPSTAAAYVGPGAGLTMLGALWAVIAAIVIAIGGLLIWPIRAMVRSRKRSAAADPKAAAERTEHTGD